MLDNHEVYLLSSVFVKYRRKVDFPVFLGATTPTLRQGLCSASARMAWAQ
jgi:hypothetical protein